MVKIIGWGEPLLNPDLINILNKLKEIKKRNTKIQIVTNGTIADEKLWDDILNTDCLDTIIFSVDGVGDAQSYEEIRKFNFNQLVANINFITSKIKKHNIDIITAINNIYKGDESFEFRQKIQNNLNLSFKNIDKIDSAEYKECFGVNTTEKRNKPCTYGVAPFFKINIYGECVICSFVDVFSVGNIKKNTLEDFMRLRKELYQEMFYDMVEKNIYPKECEKCNACNRPDKYKLTIERKNV
jgi:MoaA/NifB/PqqE/SkfB family radical SAM enzyme